MKLSDYNSLCALHSKRIVCKDEKNSQKYIANNVDDSEVYKYRIDGEVIKEGKKCDFLVLNKDKNDIYLIELKGSDLEYAIEQLLETEKVLLKRFYEEIGKSSFMYRVVLNKARTHSLHSNKTKTFMKNHVNRYVFKNTVLKENI